jgi:F-type H+-transporting ATPase subunit alpha
LLSTLRSKHPDVLETIRTTRDLDDAAAAKLKDVVDAYAKSFA